jgi:hypothetical protein
MKKYLKLVAMVLCICMTFTAIPISAFAAEGAVKETANKGACCILNSEVHCSVYNKPLFISHNRHSNSWL